MLCVAAQMNEVHVGARLGANLLKVTELRVEAKDVISIELRHPKDDRLMPFTPGAHLELEMTTSFGSCIRQYSICNSPSESHRYVISVALAANGRGGSKFIHGHIRVGDLISVRGPRNNFPLMQDAAIYRFIAGGIGITPILAMIRWCEQAGKKWSLLYCARSKLRCAFYEELSSFGSKVKFHFDDESESGPHALLNSLRAPLQGEHVFCCGPTGLMQAVVDAAEEWPEGSAHFEWFSSPDVGATKLPAVSDSEFEILLNRSGKRIVVSAGTSVLDVLEANGFCPPYACREGVCRACEVEVLEGEIDHKDYALTESEKSRGKTMLICVSRSKTPTITLNI